LFFLSGRFEVPCFPTGLVRGGFSVSLPLVLVGGRSFLLGFSFFIFFYPRSNAGTSGPSCSRSWFPLPTPGDVEAPHSFMISIRLVSIYSPPYHPPCIPLPLPKQGSIAWFFLFLPETAEPNNFAHSFLVFKSVVVLPRFGASPFLSPP